MTGYKPQIGDLRRNTMVGGIWRCVAPVHNVSNMYFWVNVDLPDTKDRRYWCIWNSIHWEPIEVGEIQILT